jgi:uncharacterized protein (UPF0335 family)
MSKQSPKQYNTQLMTPDELGAIRTLVKEFIEKIEFIDNEIGLLKEDRKDVIEDFSGKLDMKTLMMALKVIKIQKGVQHRDTFDLFVEALTDEAK